MAPGHGFEPRLLGPEPSVLPLDDPGIYKILYYININLKTLLLS